MLVILRADAINNVLSLKDVFLAEELLGLFVLALCAEDFSGDGFAILFLRAAGTGVHAKQSPLLIVVFLGGSDGGRDARGEQANSQSAEFHRVSPLSVTG